MRNIKQEFKRILFNYKNKNKKIILHSNVIFNNKTILEGNNVIYSNSQINDSIIGFGTYISRDCKLPNSIIGRFCCVGPNVKIVFGQHPTKKFVSVHPAFYSTRLQAGFSYVDEDKFEEHKFADKNTKKTIIIGNDVWIGQDVLILEGVKIADGSVIGAGAIVTKDTEPFSINVGVPAKIIGYRFEENHWQFLSSFEWWNKDQKWIEENKEFFEDVELFYEKFNNIKD
ncbi:CatB-related O-acetyltransferase [Anoxybacillus flavithermus]|uniref:CatB-related O-acetyltransferase n=1 Tax=Anoxybacillus flavithermus TaxID=33934 RepID=UPI0018665F32|nr:CatB-related O-acetyltransferase [Anoxybacillus flavithermus]MBE2952135.1 CatB-related O-acetyltransferase [Anoxybacillus flavithermus]MBE2954748.1 CatB-related O-acetyltransferase [Anoxybacillus flavithermus]MBE2960116.1 CatB-related O-acetyltransferase [Anoxybacillus flavithermus]